MSLEQTTELYASVLHQLLPEGLHDTAQTTLVADDIYAHAKVLAQADIDAHRLLKVLEEVPPELLPEYEAEYGLPLKCSINAGKTLEERIELLKWVRSTHNVLNRAYLEQLLSIFGVVLIDVVKFKPMLCTTACDSPVNTEQLRYKVFLRLQYPMNADMSCIIENYLPGYLRFDWMVDMPWGDWILNSSVTVNTNGIAHYTAYKTNQREYYDSFANLDLTAAIVRSLHDTDMQQWQAVKDAANKLTGVTNWTIDTESSSIIYSPSEEANESWYQIGFRTRISGAPVFYFSTKQAACNASIPYHGVMGAVRSVVITEGNASYCRMYNASNVSLGSVQLYQETNPYYKIGSTKPTLSVSFSTVAQTIILNASLSNQAISLLAEVYLENVARSIFSTDESKQFVKITDLTSQFELNKTLRT